MQPVTGIFSSQDDARRSIASLRSTGIPTEKIILLTPGDLQTGPESVPTDAAEQPGMGKAIGAVIGAAGGLSAGGLLAAAVIPGVGPVTAVGVLGAAVLAASGATVGAATGGALENFTTTGLPEDELFVYEDALRKGRSVVIVITEDGHDAAPIRELLEVEGAEAVDAARQQWWIGLQGAEREHYSASGRDFQNDEKFYRLGFETALHARHRCQEFDQVSAEMANRVEEMQRQHPGADVAEAFARGYERGREYYQNLCDESEAA
ncbi:MAG TPA: hypothetical protein VEG30_10080 [Terriglobales bacterium]|nr:hypothetical protein [Terriglobales bacterium]